MTDRPGSENDPDDSEGLGREAGPDFAAPGSGPSYGTPPGPDSSPTGPPPGPNSPPPGRPYPAEPCPPQSYPAQAYPPQSYPAQPHPQQPPPAGGRPPLSAGSPVPPAPKSNRGLTIAIVVVAVVVLIIVVGVAVIRNALTDPSGSSAGPVGEWTTPPRRKTPPLKTEPEQQQGSGFTFTSPAGWKRGDDWGDKNDGRIVDATGNQISIYIFEKDEPRQRCRNELRSLEIWVPGEISELPDRKLDGKVAPGGQLLGEETYHMRCASGPSGLYNISLKSHPDDIDATSTALTAVLDSWKWR